MPSEDTERDTAAAERPKFDVTEQVKAAQDELARVEVRIASNDVRAAELAESRKGLVAERASLRRFLRAVEPRSNRKTTPDAGNGQED